MNKLIKTVTAVALLSLAINTNLIAEEKKQITIEEMEIHLATLGAEIAQEKVKLFQKEALLYEMKLELLKKKKEAKK